MDKADEVAPLSPMLDRSERALTVQTPHLAQDRFEPNAMFVDRPEFDGAVWKRGDHFAQKRAQSRFEDRLRSGICLDVAWAWLKETRAKLPQGAPSRLAADEATETSAHPGCYRSPTPVFTSWMGFGERLT
jgi:hypothetical protein